MCAVKQDSRNIYSPGGKGTPGDTVAITHRASAADLTEAQCDAFFSPFMADRNNISTYSAYNPLYRDGLFVKTSAAPVAISSIGINTDSLLARADRDLHVIVAKLATENDVSFIIVMLGYPCEDETYAREMHCARHPCRGRARFFDRLLVTSEPAPRRFLTQRAPASCCRTPSPWRGTGAGSTVTHGAHTSVGP